MYMWDVGYTVVCPLIFLLSRLGADMIWAFQMIQSVGMIAKNAAYVPPDMNKYCHIYWTHSLDTLTRHTLEWSLYKMIKQSVLPEYSLITHSHLNIVPSGYPTFMIHVTAFFLHVFIFLASEMTLSLPCEEGLRKASMNGISPFPLEHLAGVSIPHASTTACEGGMDEIELIQSSYPYTCYSQEPVYSLLG